MVPSTSQKEHKGKSTNSFYIIQYYEEVRIQISPLEYLKSNLDQLQRLVEHCNNKDVGHVNIDANVDHQNKASTSGTSLTDEDFVLPKLFKEEEPLVSATCQMQNHIPSTFPCSSMEIG